MRGLQLHKLLAHPRLLDSRDDKSRTCQIQLPKLASHPVTSSRCGRVESNHLQLDLQSRALPSGACRVAPRARIELASPGRQPGRRPTASRGSAGQEGIEPPHNGFGIHRSSIRATDPRVELAGISASAARGVSVARGTLPCLSQALEPGVGLEPTFAASKAAVLPLDDPGKCFVSAGPCPVDDRFAHALGQGTRVTKPSRSVRSDVRVHSPGLLRAATAHTSDLRGGVSLDCSSLLD